MWPLLLTLAYLSRRPRRAVSAVCVAGVLAVTVWRFVIFDGTDKYRTFGTDFRADMLLAGALVATVVVSGKTRLISRLSEILVLPGICYIIAVWILVPDFNETTPAQFRLYYTVCLPFVWIATASIIGYLVTHQGMLLDRAMSVRFLKYTGTISYGIYLWHYPVIAALQSKLHNKNFLLVAALIGTYIAAGLSYRYLERPLHNRWHANLKPGVRARRLEEGEPSPHTM